MKLLAACLGAVEPVCSAIESVNGILEHRFAESLSPVWFIVRSTGSFIYKYRALLAFFYSQFRPAISACNCYLPFLRHTYPPFLPAVCTCHFYRKRVTHTYIQTYDLRFFMLSTHRDRLVSCGSSLRSVLSKRVYFVSSCDH